MVLLALLLLHSELAPFLVQSGLQESLNVNLITLWSLAVILFEMMMKGFIEKVITVILVNRLKIRLDWH